MAQTGHIYRSCSSLFHTCHFSVTNRRSGEFLSNFHWNYEKFNWFCSGYFHQDTARRYSMGHKQKETFLIAGLGNHDLPGTRHSVGMQLVKKLAEFLNTSLVKNRDCLGFVGEKELSHIHVVLLKPKQAMNINGTSVHKTAKKYHVPVSNIYLVHDDLDKKVGKVGLKEMGSAGGHNGVKSVIQSFKTDAITRVKIGIDRPASKDMVAEYVLQRFHPSEKDDVEHAIDQGILKLAQHIGTRTSLKAAQVFHVSEKSDQSDDSDGTRSSEKKNDDVEVT